MARSKFCTCLLFYDDLESTLQAIFRQDVPLLDVAASYLSSISLIDVRTARRGLVSILMTLKYAHCLKVGLVLTGFKDFHTSYNDGGKRLRLVDLLGVMSTTVPNIMCIGFVSHGYYTVCHYPINSPVLPINKICHNCRAMNRETNSSRAGSCERSTLQGKMTIPPRSIDPVGCQPQPRDSTATPCS
ncbi:hypothetical protein K491DRAFT_271708 [Lophiostoma macrostomum CBS 122681]|uniref:Uncharacterized protein n=1 Tax=Lophiostoma macrostomum CBS 122681 TaxID=1314788 RepID=A0A6A6SMU8_9PLEO|nr:hypothetical protein K491DRAFT_271708 [Lophiostoma macrostomum CBS 122681]